MKILFATTVLPAKRRTGGEIVSDTFVQRLALLGHQVDVAGYVRLGDRRSARATDLIMDERSIETDSASKSSTVGWIAQALLRGWPYSGSKYYSGGYVRLLDKSAQYDLLIVDHAQLGILIGDRVKAKHIVHISHNIEHDLYRQQATSTAHFAKRIFLGREAAKMKSLEKHLARSCEQVWCLTKADSEWFGRFNKNTHVFAVPSNSEISAQSLPDGMKRDIGIIGTWTWDANRKGLEWFFDHVYPLLPSDLKIDVAGKGADWLKGRFTNVNYLGFVDSANDFMRQSQVIAVPSVEGGGIQIKTLDAISSGRSVVGTTISVRGIDNLPDSVLIADNPDQFAATLMRAVQHNDGAASDRAIAWIKQRNEDFDIQLKRCLEGLQ